MPVFRLTFRRPWRRPSLSFCLHPVDSAGQHMPLSTQGGIVCRRSRPEFPIPFFAKSGPRLADIRVSARSPGAPPDVTLIEPPAKSRSANRRLAVGRHADHQQADFRRAFETQASSPCHRDQAGSMSGSISSPDEDNDQSSRITRSAVVADSARTALVTGSAVSTSNPSIDPTSRKTVPERTGTKNMHPRQAQASTSGQSLSRLRPVAPAAADVADPGSTIMTVSSDAPSNTVPTDPAPAGGSPLVEKLPSPSHPAAADSKAGSQANVGLHAVPGGRHAPTLEPAVRSALTNVEPLVPSMRSETSALHGATTAVALDPKTAPAVGRTVEASGTPGARDLRDLPGTRADASGGHVVLQPSGDISVQMSLAHLGIIEVKMSKETDPNPVVTVSVDRPDTLRTLVGDQAQLKAALHQSGIDQGGRTIEYTLLPPAGSADSTRSTDSNQDRGSRQADKQQFESWRNPGRSSATDPPYDNAQSEARLALGTIDITA